MDRIGRVLTVAGAAGMMVWMTSCSKPAAPEGATPTGAPGAAGKPLAGGEAAKPGADAAKPAVDASASPELAALKEKVAALKSYHMTMKMDGKEMSIRAKLAGGKPQKMRIDNSEMPGYMVYDLSTKTIYMVNDKSKEAMKMTIGPDQTEQMPDNVGDSIDMVIEQKPKLSSEKIDGVDCWKAVTTKDKVESTAWFGKDTGLPMQVKQGDKTIKMAYTEINKVADKDFELPKDLTIKDMGDMSKNMPGKAK
ncbi:MAG: hypothetical protein HZB16_16115 [Armatimonadetes bacterium]|nr:hypothetical protein [Armatimonadota bacterium]